MRLIRASLLISSLLPVSACATGYHAAGIGGGYSDLRLSDDTFKVEFQGNGYASADIVQSYFLRRCAELAQENGFEYFQLVSEDDTSATEDVQIGREKSETTGSINDSYNGARTFSAITTTRHPTHMLVTRSRSTGFIRVYRSGEQPPGAMKASTVLSNFTDE